MDAASEMVLRSQENSSAHGYDEHAKAVSSPTVRKEMKNDALPISSLSTAHS